MNGKEILYLSRSKGDSHFNKNMSQWNIKLHNFISLLSEPQKIVSKIEVVEKGKKYKDYKYFRVGPLTDPTNSERNKNIDKAYVMVLDLDSTYDPVAKEKVKGVGCPDIDRILNALLDMDLPYVFYTSASHQGPEYSRGRVIIPLSKSVNKQELSLLYKLAVSKLSDRGVFIDSVEDSGKNESKRIGQIWYFPVAQEEFLDQYRCEYNINNGPLPVLSWLREAEKLEEGHMTLFTENSTTNANRPQSLGEGVEFKEVINYTPKDYPDPLTFTDILNHFYNRADKIKQMLLDSGNYKAEDGPNGSVRFLWSGSTSGNAGGRLFEEPSGRLVYISHHPDDPLTGEKSKTSETGFLPVDGIDIYKNLELGLDTQSGEALTLKRANDWYMRKFCDYMTERFVMLRGIQVRFIDLFKPNGPELGEGFLRKTYGKFTLSRTDKEGKVKLTKCLETWSGRKNRFGGIIRHVDTSDGFKPGGEPIIKESGLRSVNTYVYPIYRSLPKPVYPDRKQILIDNVGFLASYDDFETNMVMGHVSDMIRNPSRRARMVPLMTTPLQRIGKSSFFELIGNLVGTDLIGVTTPHELPGGGFGSRNQFDDEVIGKLAVVIQEIDLTDSEKLYYKFYDLSKSFFMDDRLTLNRKGGTKVTTEVYFRTYAFSNNSVPFYLPKEDDRFLVVAQRPTQAMIDDKVVKDRIVGESIAGTIRIVKALRSSNRSERQWAYEALHAMWYYLRYEYDDTEYQKHLSAPMTSAKKLMINANIKPMDRFTDDLKEIAPHFIPQELYLEYMRYRMAQERMSGVGVSDVQMRKMMKIAYPIRGKNGFSVYVTNRNSGDYSKGIDKLYLMTSQSGVYLKDNWNKVQPEGYTYKDWSKFLRDELIRVTRDVKNIISVPILSEFENVMYKN